MTTYACGNGAPQALPPGFSFKIVVTGNSSNPTATFTQDNFGLCTNSDTGGVACDGTYMGLPAFITQPSTPTMCTPANCLSMNQCGQTPKPIAFTYQVTTQGTMKTLTTVSLPNTPLTTCTSQNKPNPITFNWAPM